MVITNQSQLEAALKSSLENYINIAGARVWKIIDEAIEQYYDNYYPDEYDREYQFFRSCIKTQPKWTGNTVEVVVYVDYNSMNYKRKKEGQERPSGKQVVDWASQGLHGGLDVGDDYMFWEDSMNKIDHGKVFSDIIAALRAHGFSVVHV